MTNTDSDDLVRDATALIEANQSTFVADTLQGLLDRIAQLEREKVAAEKALQIAAGDAQVYDTEADTLARLLMTHYPRADVEWLLTYASKETKQALTIAQRRTEKA